MAKSKKAELPTEEITVEVAALNDKELQGVIKNAIKQYSVTDAAIAELKAKYGALSVKSVEDKESYALVKTALSDVRQYRYAVENKRKMLNRNAIDYKNAVDSEAKRITEALLEIEEPLKQSKEWFDNEKEKAKAEEEYRKHQQFVERTTLLLQNGFQFNGSMYVLDTLHVTTNQVREFDDAQWAEVATRATELGAERLKAEQAKQSEMQSMLQERYESRSSWLTANGYVLNANTNRWSLKGIVLGSDADVRDNAKEAWQQMVARNKQQVAKTYPTQEQAAPHPQPTLTPAPAPQQAAAAPIEAVGKVEVGEASDAVLTVPATEFNRGVMACKAAILTKFHDGTQRTRAQWIELITNIIIS
jgi:hypothetical protein